MRDRDTGEQGNGASGVTPPDRAPVVVSEEDREAAAANIKRRLVWQHGGEQPWMDASTASMRMGEQDDHDEVQAFARHRQSFASPAAEREVARVMARVQHVLSVAANYSDAVRNGGEFADNHRADLEAMNGDVITDDSRILALLAKRPTAEVDEVELPADVRRLVIAARAFIDQETIASGNDDEHRELNAAAEAFASRVRWEDEPKDDAALGGRL